MISVFHINRFAKIVIGLTLALLFFLVVYSVWLIFSLAHETGIDRSNAMQVAKKIEDDSPHLGTPLSVLTPADKVPDFFAEYRLERDKIRSERTDLLRDILQSAKTDNVREQAQNAILHMTLEKQLESEMENLIKSKGFGDALVFIRENSVSAIVKTTSLSKDEVIQVADVISRVSGAKAEDITVSAKP